MKKEEKKNFKAWSLTFLLLGSFALIGGACQPYVGSETCQACHPLIYTSFIQTGHPYKFNLVNGAAPTYPSFVENFMALPTGASSWNDIAGVIGGWGWKARFVDTEGWVVGTASSIVNTGGGQNQLNFFEHFGDRPTWSDYHPEDEKQYNYSCFKCHTTGAVSADETERNWIVEHLGIDNDEDLGFFEFGGIECEECHGSGGTHVLTQKAEDITKPDGEAINDLCGRCHTRLADRNVQTSGDYVRHHEQYDEFIRTKHYKNASMNCYSCHDPHKKILWSGDGNETTCTSSCHSTVTAAGPHASTDCITCHMAYIAKSAQATGYLKGDVRSHTFSINSDTEYEMIGDHPTDEGVEIMNVDENGLTHIALSYACYQCHQDGEGNGGSGSEKTLAELSTYAKTMHE